MSFTQVLGPFGTTVIYIALANSKTDKMFIKFSKILSFAVEGLGKGEALADHGECVS